MEVPLLRNAPERRRDDDSSIYSCMGVKEVVVSFEEALTDRTTFMDERLETTTGKYDTYLFTTMTVIA